MNKKITILITTLVILLNMSLIYYSDLKNDGKVLPILFFSNIAFLIYSIINKKNKLIITAILLFAISSLWSFIFFITHVQFLTR